MPDKVIAQPERPIRQERAPLRAEVFRRPDPGFEPMATNVVRPSDGVLFGSNAAEERPEVNWATVLFGMAAAAMLVGTISYGAARFLNGQPVQHLFQISRDESSARVEPQSAQIPTSQSSTPEPVQPSPSSALPPTPTEPKQPDVAVAPTAPADGRTADASPSPSPVSTPRARSGPIPADAIASVTVCWIEAACRRRRSRQHGAGDREAACHRQRGAQRIAATIAATTLRRPSHTATTRADRRSGAPTGSSIRAARHRGHEWFATGTSACSRSATGSGVAGAGVVIFRIARPSAARPGAIESHIRRVAR